MSGYNSLPIYNICIAKSFYSSSLNNNYIDRMLTFRLDPVPTAGLPVLMAKLATGKTLLTRAANFPFFTR
jgi:hypothetical protein